MALVIAKPKCSACSACAGAVGDVGILGIGTGTALVLGAIGVFAYLQLFKKRR